MILTLLATAALAADAPCTALPPATVAERLRDMLASGDNARASELVASAEVGFPCLDAFVTAVDLASVYQLGGTAAYYGTRRDEAAPLFRRAVIVAPSVPFDGANLGTEAAAAYEAARIEVAAAPMGTLIAIGPVVVDGSALRAGSSVVVPAGEHLLQEGADGKVRSSVLHVEAGAAQRVGTPDPALLAAQEALVRRKKGSAYGTAAGLALLGGGLYGAAVAQERSLLDLDPESVEDPEQRARVAQIGTNAALLGAALSFGGSFAFAWRGASFRVELQPSLSASASAANGVSSP